METLHFPLKHHGPARYADPVPFQRGRDGASAKKVQRKLQVKFRHLFLFFFLLCGSLYSIVRLYLFLITGNLFAVERTEIVCRSESVRKDLEAFFDALKLGNLLLLDIERLKARVESHPWIKEARLRKIFPSALEVEIREREPRALLALDGAYVLIDREGAHLGILDSPGDLPFPVFVDAARFRDDYPEKLDPAWRLLAELSPEEIQSLEAIDVTRKDNIALRFRDHPTTVFLGDSEFASRLRFYLAACDGLEAQAGPLEYVDLSIEGRLYFKPLPALASAATESPPPEVEP